jgi:hypothetical protein
MRIVLGEFERFHSRSKRLYDSSIDYISTDSSVHPVEIAIPKDLVSTCNTVALVDNISSPKFFSSQTEWLGHTWRLTSFHSDPIRSGAVIVMRQMS